MKQAPILTLLTLVFQAFANCDCGYRYLLIFALLYSLAHLGTASTQSTPTSSGSSPMSWRPTSSTPKRPISPYTATSTKTGSQKSTTRPRKSSARNSAPRCRPAMSLSTLYRMDNGVDKLLRLPTQVCSSGFATQ
jgi:hypothetical protein